jgi:hypothetical protein
MALEDEVKRGSFQFEVTNDGNLTNSLENVETLRKLWLDRSLVSGADLGPGDEGDFDSGAWHVSCHLAGAGGVVRNRSGILLWLEISHQAQPDEYYASATFGDSGRTTTFRLDSPDGRAALDGSVLLGYVEGNSTGRTSARNVSDSQSIFNRWRRQDFDRTIESTQDGGKVWEHWCTLRDIRPEAKIGISVLTAYLGLCSALGDRFSPTVARGRRDYAHPRQLVALIRAGFTAEQSARWDIRPTMIPPTPEALFLQADPAKCLEAAKLLDWEGPPKYFMYERRIRRWSLSEQVGSDLLQAA